MFQLRLLQASLEASQTRCCLTLHASEDKSGDSDARTDLLLWDLVLQGRFEMDCGAETNGVLQACAQAGARQGTETPTNGRESRHKDQAAYRNPLIEGRIAETDLDGSWARELSSRAQRSDRALLRSGQNSTAQSHFCPHVTVRQVKQISHCSILLAYQFACSFRQNGRAF